MIPCPLCNARSGVVDSGQPKHLPYFRRRRQCLECGHRFTTREIVATSLPRARGFTPLPVKCPGCRVRLPVSMWGKKHGCSTALVPVPEVLATEGLLTLTRFPDLAGGFVYRRFGGPVWWDQTFSHFYKAVWHYLNSRDYHRLEQDR